MIFSETTNAAWNLRKFLGINQYPLKPTTIFALQYATKVYEVRAANENVITESLPIFSPKGKTCFLPSIPPLALLQSLGLDFLPIPVYQCRQIYVNEVWGFSH